jgi:hypothetical protein
VFCTTNLGLQLGSSSLAEGATVSNLSRKIFILIILCPLLISSLDADRQSSLNFAAGELSY